MSKDENKFVNFTTLTAFVVAILTLHGLQTNVEDLFYLFSVSASYGLGLNTLANEFKERIFG